MADETASDKGKTESEQDLGLRLRRQLSNAYSALLGDQTIASFTAFTFEEAMDREIEHIEGEGTQIRPNALDRVTKIETELLKAVDELKALPPEAFIEKDEEDDVNTEKEVT